MPSRTAQAPSPVLTAAIRLGVALVGTIGFALSYDALRQMAVAIHIRGVLTYAFPLVIDGFIAIGVAALLILRTAPWRSRLYVWALVTSPRSPASGRTPCTPSASTSRHTPPVSIWTM